MVHLLAANHRSQQCRWTDLPYKADGPRFHYLLLAARA